MPSETFNGQNEEEAKPETTALQCAAPVVVSSLEDCAFDVLFKPILFHSGIDSLSCRLKTVKTESFCSTNSNPEVCWF